MLDHHDALRLSFRRDPGGPWRQRYRPVGEPVALSVEDLSGLEAAARGPAFVAAASRLQASLDLADGPLLRTGLFRLGQAGDRLLLVAHHLVIDGVSWRILLDDLTQAYATTQAGDPVQLPRRTDSYKRWAEALVRQADGARAELDYWSEVVAGPRDLPDDDVGAADPDTEAAAATVVVRLAATTTTQLLGAARRAYRTEPDDLLLTAWMRALRRWRGVSELVLDLEGHGRDAVPGGDVTRTVGWFTTLYPVRLATGGGIGADIAAVKEALRRVPGQGAGYGLLRWLCGADALRRAGGTAVAFNYLGRVELPGGSGWELAEEGTGEAVAGVNRRGHALEINAAVVGGHLTVSLRYAAGRWRGGSMAGLAGALEAELEAMVAHCMDPASFGRTPSDFPLAGLTQHQLDALPRQTEDVYPLAPAQHGILFHAVLEPSSPAYVEQHIFEITGQLDPARFEQAWRALVQRHAALRTVFRWQDGESPIQIVLLQMRVPLTVHDLSRLDDAGRREAIDSFLAQDRTLGFDLRRAPCSGSISSGSDPADSASSVATTTRCSMAGRSPYCWPTCSGSMAPAPQAMGAMPSPPPYRDYIAWLRRRDPARSLAFWDAYLAGLEEPMRLPLMAGTTSEGPVGGTLSWTADAALARRLEDVARRHRCTLSTVFQAVWAILIARHCRRSDVVFGVTVSGRPADLPDADRMVGLFINTVPVRVTLRPETTVDVLLAALQAHAPDAADHADVNLAEIQCRAFVGGQDLFDSIIVFANYPVTSAEVTEGVADLRVETVAAQELTNYPLTLVAVPRPNLELRLLYRADLYSTPLAEGLLCGCATLLEAIAAGHEPLALRLPVVSGEMRMRCSASRLSGTWPNAASGMCSTSSPTKPSGPPTPRRCPSRVAASAMPSSTGCRQCWRPGYSLRA